MPPPPAMSPSFRKGRHWANMESIYIALIKNLWLGHIWNIQYSFLHPYSILLKKQKVSKRESKMNRGLNFLKGYGNRIWFSFKLGKQMMKGDMLEPYKIMPGELREKSIYSPWPGVNQWMVLRWGSSYFSRVECLMTITRFEGLKVQWFSTFFFNKTLK